MGNTQPMANRCDSRNSDPFLQGAREPVFWHQERLKPQTHRCSDCMQCRGRQLRLVNPHRIRKAARRSGGSSSLSPPLIGTGGDCYISARSLIGRNACSLHILEVLQGGLSLLGRFLGQE